MKLSKKEVLLSIYRGEKIDCLNNRIIIELRNDGLIIGLFAPKYIKKNDGMYLADSGYIPGKTKLTELGNQFLADNLLNDKKI